MTRYSRLFRQHFLDFFLWSLWDNIAQDFSCAMLSQEYYDNVEQCCPRSIKTILHKIFPVQCCLEALRQHCIGFGPGQCCPKSIKTKLNKIISCVLLSGASKTTLHMVFICAIIFPEKTLQHCTWKTLCSIALWGSTQHCLRKNPVLCCLNIIWAILYR